MNNYLFIFCFVIASSSVAYAQTTLQEALRTVRELRAQMQQKDEYETTKEFEARQSRIQGKLDILFRAVYPSIFNGTIGAYDADNETYPLTIGSVSEQFLLKIPRTAARSMEKETMSKLKASGNFYIEPDGQVYAASPLSVSIGSTVYHTLWEKPKIRILRTHVLVHESKETILTDPSKEKIYDLAFTPDGHKLASSSNHNTVILWDVSSAQPLRTLSHEPSSAYSVAFSPDGRFLAVGRDRSLTLWNPTVGQQLRDFNAENSKITSLDFAPTGYLLALGQYDVLLIWDLTTPTNPHGSRIKNPGGGLPADIHSVSFSKNQKTIAVAEGNSIALYTVPGLKGLKTQTFSNSTYIKTKFSPDGKYLSIAVNEILTSDIRIWDASNLQELVSFSAHPAAVTSFCYLHEPGFLATASFVYRTGMYQNQPSWEVTFWDIKKGTELRRMYGGNATPAVNVASSPTEGYLAVAIGNIIDLHEVTVIQHSAD